VDAELCSAAGWGDTLVARYHLSGNPHPDAALALK
jgi:hypothetical protein